MTAEMSIPFSQPATVTMPYAYNKPNWVESVGGAYANHFPEANAAISTILTPGSASRKMNEGVKAYGEAFIFEKIADALKKQQLKFYSKHPGYANWANKHPILSGMANFFVLFIPAMAGATAARFGWDTLSKKTGWNAYMTRVGRSFDSSSLGRRLNNTFGKMGGARKAVGAALALGFPVYLLLLLGKRVVEGFQFKKAYKESAAEHPDASPYDLQHDAALDLMMADLERHPMRYGMTPEALMAMNPFTLAPEVTAEQTGN